MISTEGLREKLLAALAQLSRLRPEWRMGQTLSNLAMTAGRVDPGGVWDLEDEEALAAAKRLIEQYSQPAPPVATDRGIAMAADHRQPQQAGSA